MVKWINHSPCKPGVMGSIRWEFKLWPHPHMTLDVGRTLNTHKNIYIVFHDNRYILFYKIIGFALA